MESLIFLLSNHTFRIVILGCTMLGICSGVLGSFVYLRRQSLLGDTIAHVTLPGIAIAFLIQNNTAPKFLFLGAIFASLLSVFLINIIKKYTKLKFDSILAYILSTFFGIGLMLLSYINKLQGASKAGLDGIIFGEASLLLRKDVKMIFIVSLVIIVLIILFWKELKLSSFDAIYGEAMGFSFKILEYFLSILIVTCIIVGIQTMGVILISSLLIAPPIAARQWTNKLSIMILMASIIGGISSIIGTVLSSTISRTPTGPVIAVILSFIVILSLLFSPTRGIISDQRKKKLNMKKNFL